MPDSLLTTIPMPAGGTAVVLAQAAPKWQALLAAMAAAGYRVACVGGYRPYDEQVALLKARYEVVSYKADIEWNGQHWKHVRDAVVATPGTSTHGWGLAIDLGVDWGNAVDWLCAHASEYGISAELQSEPWHWRPFDGDAQTPAVLAYTLSVYTTTPSTMEEEMPAYLVLPKPDGTVFEVVAGQAPKSLNLDDWNLAQRLYPNAKTPIEVTRADIDRLTARAGQPAVDLGPVLAGIAAIKAALTPVPLDPIEVEDQAPILAALAALSDQVTSLRRHLGDATAE